MIWFTLSFESRSRSQLLIYQTIWFQPTDPHCLRPLPLIGTDELNLRSSGLLLSLIGKNWQVRFGLADVVELLGPGQHLLVGDEAVELALVLQVTEVKSVLQAETVHGLRLGRSEEKIIQMKFQKVLYPFLYKERGEQRGWFWEVELLSLGLLAFKSTASPKLSSNTRSDFFLKNYFQTLIAYSDR